LGEDVHESLPMRTIICGGRDYVLTDADRAWLDRLKGSLPITEVVCGMSGTVDRETGRVICGADLMSRDWALERGIRVTPFPAIWRVNRRLDKSAGPRRNQAMANHCALSLPAACVAFPGGRGTKDMLAKAEAKGLVIVRRET